MKYLALAIAFSALVWGMVACDQHSEDNLKQERAEKLIMAKEGWVYKCGWQCNWEKIK